MKNSGGKKLIFRRAKEDLRTRKMDVFLLNIDAMPYGVDMLTGSTFLQMPLSTENLHPFFCLLS